MNIKNLLIVIVVIGVLIVGFYALNNYIYNEKQAEAPAPIVSMGVPTFLHGDLKRPRH